MSLDGKKLVIGIDGGGTKTHGVLCKEGGEVLAEDFAPSSNPNSNPEEKVRQALHGLVDALVKSAGVALEQVDGICLGMSGVDRPTDRSLIEGIMRARIGEKMELLLVNDAVIGMVAVLGKLHGILVIAGTGSICFGYHDGKQERRRSGGWGHLLGDEGSGYMIGLSALKAIMDAYDGRRPETTLTLRILEDQNLRAAPDLVHWTYRAGNGKPEIAALARLVHEEAEKGDAVALGILEEQASELTDLVRPVYTHLFGFGEPVQLALWGGNLVHCTKYRELFLAKLSESGMKLEPVMHDVEAVHGAATHILNHLAGAPS